MRKELLSPRTQGHLEVMKIKVVAAFPQFPSMLSAFLLTSNLISRTEMYSGCFGDLHQSPTFWKW